VLPDSRAGLIGLAMKKMFSSTKRATADAHRIITQRVRRGNKVVRLVVKLTEKLKNIKQNQ
jgi:hypothetical protein